MDEERTINKTAPDYLPGKQMMPVVHTVNGERIPFSSLIRIDPDNLVPEYELQAPWAAAIGYAASMKEIAVERKEREIKVAEARAFITAKRGKPIVEGEEVETVGKPPADSMAKARAMASHTLEELYEELFVLKEQAAALVSARIAWAARKEMIVNLGAEIRIDKKSGSGF